MMKRFSLFGLFLIFSLTTLTAQPMNPADFKALEGLLNTILYRPDKSDKFVSLQIERGDAWGSINKVKCFGWQKVASSDIYLTDGEKILLSEADSIEVLDFQKFAANHENPEETFAKMDLEALGLYPPQDIVLAAWFHALEEDETAKKIIAKALKSNQEEKLSIDQLILGLKEELAWSAYSGMVHAYMQRFDTKALAHGQRLVKHYPEQLLAYPQATALVAELERRQKAGNFDNQAMTEAPPSFFKLNIGEQIDYLINALDEVDQRQWGQPGGVSLAEDWRVQALIGIGDTAVLQLIEVIESDNRFTRSVHFWRDFSRNRTVLNVKEAALTAIMSIWQDDLFSPASTGDNFTSRGQEAAKALAVQLREQLKTYTGKTLEMRKLELMLDKKAEGHDRRQAAQDLANFGFRRTVGTTVWSGRWMKRYEGENPLIDKWKNPNLAEMIWQVMFEDLADFDAAKDYMDKEYYRQRIEAHYLSCLTELQDTRIVQKIQDAYAKAKEPYQLRQFAFTAYYLGDSLLWDDYCMRLQAGNIQLPKIEYSNGSIEWSNPMKQPGNRELTAILAALMDIDNKLSKTTFNKIKSPEHPFYKWIELRLLQLPGGYDDDGNTKEIWYNKDLCFDIYIKNLDNQKDSDSSLRFYPNSGITSVMDWGGQSGLRLHKKWEISGFANGKETLLRARHCDMVANKLYQLIFGIPACHAHLGDKDERIARQKQFMQRFTEFRQVTSSEYNKVNELYAGLRYIPVLSVLDHPATQEEVDNGKALFYIENSVAIADIKLPFVAIRKVDEKEEKPMRIYVWQAEVDKKGAIHYGALTEDGPQLYKDGELINFEYLEGE